MSRRARLCACLAASVLPLAGCGGGGDAPPAPTSLGGTTGGGMPSSSTLSPAPRVFDARALEDGVRQVLTQSYGLADVGEVRCPSGQFVQAGISFDCEVVVGGARKNVTLTVQGLDGTYQVSQPR
ncbi:DUF4333 domain-containing protein [Amycolatopsis sacchari]|uniref:DUF4333 domain-containing protein n=1 Tax=Amycolatopsis sacchari TaxID=115433 RepID=UPI003EC05315